LVHFLHNAECLSLEWFRSRAEAKAVIETWRRLYNEVRPHSSLGYLTPAAFAAKIRNAAPADVTERTAAAHGAFALHSVTSEDKPEATRADLSS
jgi:hypothetical protein